MRSHAEVDIATRVAEGAAEIRQTSRAYWRSHSEMLHRIRSREPIFRTSDVRAHEWRGAGTE